MKTLNWLRLIHWGYFIFSLGCTFFAFKYGKECVERNSCENNALAAALKQCALVRLILINVFHIIQNAFVFLISFLFLGKPRNEKEMSLGFTATLNFLLFQVSFYLCSFRQVKATELMMWLFWNGISGSILVLNSITRVRFDTITSTKGVVRFSDNVFLGVFISILMFAALGNVLNIAFILPGDVWGLKSAVFLHALIGLVKTTAILLRAIHHEREARNLICWEQRALMTLRIVIAERFICLTLFVIQAVILMLLHKSLSLILIFLTCKAAYLFKKLMQFLDYYRQSKTFMMLVNSSFTIKKVPEIPVDRRECPICHDPLGEAICLDCGHYFHRSCLIPSLNRAEICPVCRSAVEYHTNPSYDDSVYDSSLEVIMHLLNIPLYTASEKMVEQVAELLPDVPRLRIIKDIVITGSVDISIERLRDKSPRSHSPPVLPVSPSQQQPDFSMQNERNRYIETAMNGDAAERRHHSPDDGVKPAVQGKPKTYLQRKLELLHCACEKFHLQCPCAAARGLIDKSKQT